MINYRITVYDKHYENDPLRFMYSNLLEYNTETIYSKEELSRLFDNGIMLIPTDGFVTIDQINSKDLINKLLIEFPDITYNKINELDRILIKK